MDKEELRTKLLEVKQSYINKNKERLDTIEPLWLETQSLVPELDKLEPYIDFCDTQELRDLWFYGRLTVSSAPWTGDVGRRFQYLIRDKSTNFIVGVVGISSSLSIPLFDKHIGWSKTQKWTNKMINHTMNMSHCIATPELSNYLTGKLCALSCTSEEVVSHFEDTYNDKAVVWMTTSLFGKSSVYNRLVGFTYLGNTKGYSAMLVPLEIKEQMRRDFQEKHGKHSEIYTKEDGTVVKYGTVKTFQKLGKYTNIQRVENLRGVYVIPLATNYKEFLTQQTNVLESIECKPFSTIVEDWAERWYHPRIERLQQGLTFTE